MVESEDNKRGRIHRHGDGCELYSSDCTTISIQSAIARFSPGNSVPPLALFDQEASRRGGDRQQKSPLGFSLSLSLSSKILSSLLSQILKSPRAPSRITNNSLFPVSFRPFLQFLSRKKKIKGERKKSGHHAWWAKHSILTFACFSSIVSLHDYAIAYVLQKQNSPIWLLFFSLIRLLT